MTDTQTPCSRRDFFRRIGRWAGGGALAAMASVLGVRAHRKGACLFGRTDPCSACAIEKTCSLSALREAKR